MLWTSLKMSERSTNPKQAVADLNVPCTSCCAAYNPALWQPALVHSIASPKCLQTQHKQLTNYRSLRSSCEVALGQAQAAADLGLHQSPSQESPDPTHLVASFIPHQSITQPPPHMKEGLGWHQKPTKATPALYIQPICNISSNYSHT